MKRLAGCGLILVGLVAACGGKRNGTGPDYPYPTEESFCAQVAESECNDAVVKACYGSDQSTLLEDRASCAAARTAGCNPLGLPYHPELAQECVIARQEAIEDAVWTKAE